MERDFAQISWDAQLADDCRQLIRLAVREDLDRGHDLTTLSLVPAGRRGAAAVVARQKGILCGVPAVQLIVEELNLDLELSLLAQDGQAVSQGAAVAELAGSVRDLLTSERLILNFLGRLSGVATVARTYVDAIQGTAAQIYDTRKTTPGYRRLEKYAVRCGGGRNHRTGLFDAVLIKDNHLAQAGNVLSPAAAVQAARRLETDSKSQPAAATPAPLIEIEVDDLEQLTDVLTAQPDLVLLDNMPPEQLKRAVRLCSDAGGNTQLEASGGITLHNVRTVAETGVQRISVGALTHSAGWLDVGLDWSSGP